MSLKKDNHQLNKLSINNNKIYRNFKNYKRFSRRFNRKLYNNRKEIRS